MNKPPQIFGRAREWQGLVSFADSPLAVTQNAASLGVVSGRRRQGKSFLLQAVVEQSDGLYFAATEATEAESLRLFSEALARHTQQFIAEPSGTGMTP